MTREEQAYNKAHALQQEISEMRVYMNNILDEKERLHYYYMDNPDASSKKVGQKIRRLENMYEKYRVKIARHEREIIRLRNKYGF